MANIRNRYRIIITGARKGIGRQLTEYYLKQGNQVAGCSRSETDLQHENYSHYCLDVGSEEAVKKMVLEVKRELGGIDILINNAGIASMNHTFLTPHSIIEQIYRTNVFGSFLFMREAGKIMATQKYGRIVNFATVATPLNLEGEAAYASSKAAIEKLTTILAREFAPYNITVNAVGPTPVYTDLIKNVPEEKMETLVQRQAIHRYGEMKDIANVIDFFIKPQSDFITGQIVYLGGISR